VILASVSRSRRDKTILLGLAAAAALLLAVRWTEFPVGAATDDAYYVEMARSLAAGRGPVLDLNPAVAPAAPDLFPVGYPALLSPLAALRPHSLEILKIPGLLALLLLGPLSLALFRRGCARHTSWLLTGLLVLNPWIIAFSCRVLADVPFTAISLGAVLLFLDWSDRPQPGWRRGLVLVLVTALAVEVRTIGLALPAAMVLHLLLLRRWRPALWLCVACTVVITASGWLDPVGSGPITGGYREQVFGQATDPGSRLALMGGNLAGYVKELPPLLLPAFGSPVHRLVAGAGAGAAYAPLLIVTGILLGVAILGGLSGGKAPGRSSGRFLLVYLVLYGGVLLNFSGYPTGVQLRLLLPVLPILLWGAGRTLEYAAVRRPAAGKLTVPVLLLVGAMGLFHNGYRIARPLRSTGGAGGPALYDPGVGAPWIRANTGPDEVIMVRVPLKQHIHFQRPVVAFGGPTDPEREAGIARSRAAWIVVGPHPQVGPQELDIEAAGMRTFLQQRPERFRPAYDDSTGSLTIYEVVAPSD
jgi:hypothetical protein